MADKRMPPIAIFAYNRPGHLGRLFESLARCARLAECDVHIFCDGAKSERDEERVLATRTVVRKWAREHSARVVERNENYGLARSIVLGVTELCEQYGRVIVLEDDLVVSPDFLDYMLQALDRYEGDERVYQISGFIFPVENPSTPDAFFLPMTTTWGWATWARAWKHFDWEATGAMNQLSDKSIKRRFDADSTYPYAKMLEARLSGRNDSWGILWYYSVFKNDGLVLYPPRSLVWVGGFDNSGTHCGDSSMVQRPLAEIQSMHELPMLAHAEKVACDHGALSAFQRYLRRQRRWMRLRSMPRRLVFGVRYALSGGGRVKQ